MASVLFALIASFLAAMGGRDQLLVAELRARLGPSAALLAVALACAAVTAAIAAWAGALLARSLSVDAAAMFVAFALLLAAVELVWPAKPQHLAEPTRSLGAVTVVLLARQLADAARFMVAGFAVAFDAPILAGIGGAIGGGAAVALGWAMGEDLQRTIPLDRLRRMLAMVALVLALIVGLSARGLIG